jgi:hypothetical protein
MTKTLWTLPVLVALLVAGSGAGMAMPSLAGPTGVVSLPTAAIAPMNELQAALSYQSLQTPGLGMYEPSEDFTVWSLQALTGVAQKAELWGAYARVRDGEDSHLWGIGGKIQLASEPTERASLAIGGSYQDWSDALAVETGTGDVKVKNAYIVATKDFTPMGQERWEWGPGAGTRMLGSLGIMYISLDPDVGDSESLTRPFVALEFIGASDTSLGLEYRWKDDDIDEDGVFSAVLTHKFSDAVTAQVGTTNAAPGGIGLGDQDIFVRLGYSFPMGAAG